MSDALGELQLVLNTQIDLMGQGRIAEVERLTHRAGQLIERLRGDDVPAASRAAVVDSCRRLSLMVAAERDDVDRELKHLRHVRRVIQTYRERITQP